MQKPEKRIILCLAHMSGNEMKYVQEAFDTNWVVPLGPNVNGFESDLKQFVTGTAPVGPGSSSRKGEQSGLEEALERKQVVALASGTSAVHLALVALGVRAGDEVMCQSFTFCASSHPVRYLGATPVFVDSEPNSWNMDPELLETAIRDRMEKTGRKPRAIIVVYLYGMPARIRDIMAVAEKYGLPLIEDAAEALGSRYDGQVCGTFGQYGVLSFNGNKMITTSGGGALICPDAASKERIMFFATQAREAFPYYQHEEIGYNYRMSNICAGIGRGQMTVLNAHIAHHQHLAAYYREALRDVPGIAFHDNPNAHADSNFWLNTITIDPSVRVAGQERAYAEAVHGAVGGAAGVVHATGRAHTDCEPNDNVEAMRVFLDQAGIESRPLWKPMHRQPVYRDCPAYVNGVSESLFKIGLCLPSGPLVTDEDAAYIVDRIKAAIV